MRGLKVAPQYPKGMANRAIFCSRTLNLRSIQAIGVPMQTNMKCDWFVTGCKFHASRHVGSIHCCSRISRCCLYHGHVPAGYDMDYTLVHYDVDAWEGKAFNYMLQNLQSMGMTTDGLHFDATLVTRGLIVDQKLGNLVKADRFG